MRRAALWVCGIFGSSFVSFISLVSFASLVSLVFLVYSASSVSLAEGKNEQLFYQLLSELRCPQCEGQSLAESSSPIAESLRQQIERMLEQGQSPIQIKTYLVKRYGEEVLMVPNSPNHRLLLWGLPLVFLLGLVLYLYKGRVFHFRPTLN